MFEPRQTPVARISAMLVVSIAVAFTSGCHRDPNVRKQKYLESGKRYEASGKYKEAAIQFANALKVDKNFAPAYFELAKTDLQIGSSQSAYQALMRAVDLDPSNVDARITLGNMLLAGRATARAEDQAKAVLAINPNNADAYALLAGVAQRKGDNAGARTQLQRALAIDPNRSGFHSAMALLEAGTPADEADAEQELRKAASLDPKSPTPHLLLAAFLEKKNDLQGAEQQFLQAIAVAPKNLQARISLATLYLHVGDKNKAEQTLLQAVQNDPTNEPAAEVLLEFYGKTGQLDHAEQVFADLSSKNPKSFGLKMTYARILFDRKDYAKSKTVADQLTKTDASNPQVQSLDALLLLNTGKIDDALTLLKKAVKDNPNSAQMQLLLGRVAVAKGDFATAETSYTQASTLSPGNLEAENGLADVAIKRNDIGMLSEVADKTIQTHPDFSQAYLWRGTAESSRKEYDKAEADFQSVLKTNPDNPVIYIELAQLRYVQGHIPEGIALLEKALEKDPSSSRVLGMLAGYMLAAKQPPAKAVARVQAQIAKEPQNGDFYAELAYLQLKTNDIKGSVDNARKAMQLNPASPMASEIYTQGEADLGDLDGALAAWQGFVNSHPNDAHAVEVRGALEEAKGDDEKAMADFKKALELDPNNAVAANDLAYMMVENGDNIDVALTLAQTARRLLPDSADTADTLAWVFYKKENYTAARDLLESSVKTYPDSAPIHLHLGLTYSELNDKTDAIAQLKKAQALAPNGKVGKDAGAELAKLQ
jgi:tetratricopeptide (TPR) repeat protein